MDANGLPLSGALLYFYEAGTTTPITVYQDADGATPHANPVVASSAGIFAPIYVDTSPFKTTLKTAAGVTVLTVDDITTSQASTGASTDNEVVRFNGTEGLLQGSDVTIDDGGGISTPSTITSDGYIQTGDIKIFGLHSSHVFMGHLAGANNHATTDGTPQDGGSNTFIGVQAGRFNTTGYAQTMVGAGAGAANITGDGNTYFGYAAGSAGTDAKWNVAVGVDALLDNVHGKDCVAVGHHCADSVEYALGDGESVFIGAEAAHIGVGAVRSTIVGYRSGYNTNASATDSTFVGHLTGFAVTSGSSNVLVGSSVGQAMTSGSNNTVGGHRAGYSETTSSYNTAWGYTALFSATTGGSNTALGANAGFTVATGTGNVFLGYSAGYYETGANKLFIDNAARASEADGRLKALVYGEFNSSMASQFMKVNGGLVVGDGASGPTGGNKGAGTINAGAVYDDNVLLTDYVFDAYLEREPAELYSARVQAKADALDASMFEPSAFTAYWTEHGHLYGMPDANDAIDGVVDVSIGDMVQKLTQVVELQAIHIAKLTARLEALEA